MIKSLLFSTLLLLAPAATGVSFADDSAQSCTAQIPFGQPVSNDKTKNFVQICHTAYLTHYDQNAKIPDWVSYTLTPQHATGCDSRSNAFSVDPQLSATNQASPKDYDHSGYDKGHIAPDSDMRWDNRVERESFYMTNMTPQRPSLNRGIWKHLEDDVRSWALYRNEPLTIYGGPIYNNASDKKFSRDSVDIPTGFYKIIVDDQSHEAIAFEFDDQDTANGDSLESHITTIASIEAKTNITFPVPSETDKTVKSDMWPLMQGEFQADKNKACK